MACYKPLWGAPYLSDHPKYGQYHILPFGSFVEKPPDFIDYGTGELLSWTRIGCGKCIGCRLDYSREWASRIMMESLYYPDNSLFATLTYRDEDLPVSILEDKQYILRGSQFADYYAAKGATLYLKDTQDWLKRLRRTVDYHYGDSNVRFYLAGEYGSRTYRPHYHVCLFGVPVDGLSVIGKNKLGDFLYNSDILSDSWKHGHVVVGKLNYKTAAYTARYCMKKADGKDNAFFESLGVNKEFVTMSRKPGIGYQYYVDHRDEIYNNDEIILPAVSKDKGLTVKPPRYFDNHYKDHDIKNYSNIKAQRMIAAELGLGNELSQTDLDEEAYFSVKDVEKNSQAKKLLREFSILY